MALHFGKKYVIHSIKKASMPLSVVSSPNASLTPDVVSPSPPDNNEELANSSRPDLRKVALPPH